MNTAGHAANLKLVNCYVIRGYDDNISEQTHVPSVFHELQYIHAAYSRRYAMINVIVE